MNVRMFVVNKKILWIKYAVCVPKGKNIVDHLNKQDSVRIAKIIFYFLQSQPKAKCNAKVTSKRCQHEDGE